MAVTINEDSVAAIAVSAGVRRQPLMTTANNTSTPNTTRANAFTWSRLNFLARTQLRAK